MSFVTGIRPTYGSNSSGGGMDQSYVPGVGRGATPFTTRGDYGLLPGTDSRGGYGTRPPYMSQMSSGIGMPQSSAYRGTSNANIGMVSSVTSGAGRGKTIKVDPKFGPPPEDYIPGHGRGATGFSGGVSRDDSIDDRERADYSDANYDEFSGYSENLFIDTEYDEEDKEADEIYDHIEVKMDMRRKSRRETKLKEELAKRRQENPTIHQQLAPYKRGLADVSKEEWESIPEIGDYSLKQKRKKSHLTTPVPERILMQARASQQAVGIVDSRVQHGGMNTPLGLSTPIGLGGLKTPFGLMTPLGMQSSFGGLQTPLGLKTPFGLRTPGSGPTPSLNDLGEARGTVLSVKLDKVMDNVSGQTVINPKGYLTDLNSLQAQSETDIQDIKKARLLLKSVTQTNPKHAPGWIAASRLEEIAGKLQTARELIATGCRHCPKNEDIWLEAVRLEKPVTAKAFLAKAIQQLPYSVRLWLDAARREEDLKDKRRVLRKSLEFIPNAVRLWKELVSLEKEEDAKELLNRATDCCPQSVDLWLALARLSPYAEAQKVLNRARQHIPTSPEIWISAAKLEETIQHDNMVDVIVKRAIENLQAKGVNIERDAWLKLAEESELAKYIKTSQSIITHTMRIGVEEVNMKRIWNDDATSSLARGCIETARQVYNSALKILTTKKSLWLALAELETKHGTPESLEAVLQKSVAYCPDAEVLWLMAAKQKWLSGDIQRARQILAEAFSHNVDAEAIYLAAIKLERENGEFARARVLLQRAQAQVNSPKVWMQSVQMERYLKLYDDANQLVEKAISLHPKYSKLHMIAGQIHLENKESIDMIKAVECFERGLKECPKSVPLWLCLIDCHAAQLKWTLARASLDKARLLNRHDDMLWLYSVQLELEAGNLKTAQHIMSKALQECPKSGLLWSEAIFLEPKAKQKSMSVDALSKCENDVHTILAVAKVFWDDNKIEKARKWLNRTVAINPSFGDAWGTFCAFEMKHGNDNSQNDVIKRCTSAEPTKGIKWNKISKAPENWKSDYEAKLKKFVSTYYPNLDPRDDMPGRSSESIL